MTSHSTKFRGMNRNLTMPLSVLLALLAIAPATATALTVDVEVDFADYRGRQKSMLGMNHGAMATPEEPERTIPAYDPFINPLDFRIWSSGARMATNGFVGMVQSNHGKSRAFLRMGAGLVKRCPYDGDKERPYRNPAAYREYVRCVTEWARDHDIDAIDVWNEPNISSFDGQPDSGKTKRQLFFETFKIAHDTIREVWPEAVIAGPSLGKVDQEEWLRDFMDYCERERLQVQILTWHENGTIWDERWFADLPGKLRKARRDYVKGAGYANVGVEEIVINEFIAERYHDIPASNLAVMYYLEKGGADAAARTCWDATVTSACFNDTLNGLVTPPDESGVQHKRAMWWVMRYYNRSLGNRVGWTSGMENLVGMANYDQILMALYERPTFTQDTGNSKLDVKLSLEGLEHIPWLDPGADALRVKVREIPWAADTEKPVSNVKVKHRRTVTIKTDAEGRRSATLKLPFKVHSVLVLELDSPDASAADTVRKNARKGGGKGKKKATPPKEGRPISDLPPRPIKFERGVDRFD